MDGHFGHDAGNPLFTGGTSGEAAAPPAALLVDETSMLDLSLAASLLDAMPTGHPTQLVLVGAGPHALFRVCAGPSWLSVRPHLPPAL